MPEVWVMIRGLAREAGHWGDFAEGFEKRYPQRRVVYLDLPGAGENRNVEPPLTMSGIVDFMRAQLFERWDDSAMGADKKYVLLGISLGGMVVMEWMSKHSAEVKKAILINTSSKRHSPFYQRLRGPAYWPMLKALAASSARKREMAILEIVSNRPEIYKEVAGRWAKIAKERPMKPLAAGKQLAAAAAYSTPEKFETETPVLVLVSLGDRMVEPQCGLDLAKSYGWNLKTHPWGGHELALDDPEWVINALR